MSFLERVSNWVQESTLIGLCGILDLQFAFLLGANHVCWIMSSLVLILLFAEVFRLIFWRLRMPFHMLGKSSFKASAPCWSMWVGGVSFLLREPPYWPVAWTCCFLLLRSRTPLGMHVSPCSLLLMVLVVLASLGCRSKWLVLVVGGTW